MSAGRIIAAVGPASVTVIGGSVTAVSIATVLVATGGAVALSLAGYGVYRWLSGENAPTQLPPNPPPADENRQLAG
jgi:hypothetical protein